MLYLCALPIQSQAIREVQNLSQDITDNLQVPTVRALDSVERVSHAFEVPFSSDLGFIRQKAMHSITKAASLPFQV